MARTRKLSSREELSKTPAEDIFETIIEDVLRARNMPVADWHALSQNLLILLSIPVPPGGQYPVTQIGIDAAHLLTQQTWDSREDLRQTFSRDSFNKASFNAIGTTIQRAHTLNLTHTHDFKRNADNQGWSGLQLNQYRFGAV